ncbi:MAG: hypothetical protein HY369_00825 [Candidatus Aenigmarchaeota archaeon]|nr:hypothetical protein [Candidatus Aenigmarchaeota archaeon]
MRKGITPIIATVILLLIAVAIAGAGYTWISGYWSGLTSNAIQITDISCNATAVTIRFSNYGTDPISASAAGIPVERTVIGGVGTAAITYGPDFVGTALDVVNPGASGRIYDTDANTADAGVTFKYFIEVGGRITTTQVTC